MLLNNCKAASRIHTTLVELALALETEEVVHGENQLGDARMVESQHAHPLLQRQAQEPLSNSRFVLVEYLHWFEAQSTRIPRQSGATGAPTLGLARCGTAGSEVSFAFHTRPAGQPNCCGHATLRVSLVQFHVMWSPLEVNNTNGGIHPAPLDTLSKGQAHKGLMLTKLLKTPQ